MIDQAIECASETHVRVVVMWYDDENVFMFKRIYDEKISWEVKLIGRRESIMKHSWKFFLNQNFGFFFKARLIRLVLILLGLSLILKLDFPSHHNKFTIE